MNRNEFFSYHLSLTTFILLIFTFSTFDIPASVLQSKLNPKTCCGRGICMCTHPKGAKCLFKHAHKHEKVEAPKPSTGFAKAPCHRTAPKASVPGTFRDFEAVSTSVPFLTQRAEFLPLFRTPFPAKIQSRGIERPPRFFLSI
jgi:hypothetical protein